MSIVDRLRSDLIAALLDTANYVRSCATEIPITHREQWKVIRTDAQRALDQRQIVSPDYSYFLGNRQGQIQEMPSFNRLIAAIQADPEITRSFRLEGTWADDFMNRYFINLASSLLQREDAGMDRKEAGSLVLNDLDSFLMKDTYLARVSTALLNFNSGVSDVELVDGIFLRRISDSELESHINSMNLLINQFGRYSLLEINFHIEALMDQDRTKNPPMATGARFQHMSEDLLKAFRLIKPGAIAYSFTVGQVIVPQGFGGIWIAMPSPENVSGQRYEFVSSDIEQLRHTLKNLRTLEKDARFSLALRRLMDAYRKPLGSDRLIDYWIGLESLLLPGEKEGELRFRAALRGAWFIGGDPTARIQIFNDLRRSYDVRSAVVHGKDRRVDDTEVVQTEQYLRLVLTRCLEHGKTPTSEAFNSLTLSGILGQPISMSPQPQREQESDYS